MEGGVEGGGEGREGGREEIREERRVGGEGERVGGEDRRERKWLQVLVNKVCGYTSKLVPLDTSGNGAWYKMYFN